MKEKTDQGATLTYSVRGSVFPTFSVIFNRKMPFSVHFNKK